MRNDFNMFLCEYMERFNEEHSGQKIGEAPLVGYVDGFARTMELANELFGERAFRLVDAEGNVVSNRVNKALFESWAVNLSKLEGASMELLKARKETLWVAFARALSTDLEFSKSVTQATGGVAAVRKRFATVKSIIDEVMYAQKN